MAVSRLATPGPGRSQPAALGHESARSGPPTRHAMLAAYGSRLGSRGSAAFDGRFPRGRSGRGWRSARQHGDAARALLASGGCRAARTPSCSPCSRQLAGCARVIPVDGSQDRLDYGATGRPIRSLPRTTTRGLFHTYDRRSERERAQRGGGVTRHLCGEPSEQAGLKSVRRHSGVTRAASSLIR